MVHATLTAMPDFVTGVDFVAIPTQDYDRAAAFYGETLGLPFRKRWGDAPAGEFQAGDVTLALMQSDAFGQEFRPRRQPAAHPPPLRAGGLTRARTT